MPLKFSKRNQRFVASGTSVAILWAIGALFVLLPLGDGLLRLSYDSLYLFAKQKADPDTIIVALNEQTDRTLERRQGEPFSRAHHAALIARLKDAGCERICYDILFDLPSSDSSADEALRQAIASHGRVILGGALDHTQRGDTAQTTVIPPFLPLRNAAESWGTLNIEPLDVDGIPRRFIPDADLTPPLAIAAANAAQNREEPPILPSTPWIQYTAPPGSIPTYEFSECLDSAVLPDEIFRGKTVFVGGNYSTDEIGSRDAHRSPYSRFGASLMPGVEWHANTYLNARDNLWLDEASTGRSLLWCLPMALGGLLVMSRWSLARKLLVLTMLGLGIPFLAVHFIWNDHILTPWLVPLLIQAPAGLAIVTVQSIRFRGFRDLEPISRPSLENLVAFISFATPDRPDAEDVYRALNDCGHKTWISLEGIHPGSVWPKELATAIQNCRLVVFLISKDSLRSTYCESELNLAMSLKKPIIPVALDASRLPPDKKFLMGRRQIITAYDTPQPTVIRQILAAIDEALSDSENKPHPQE